MFELGPPLIREVEAKHFEALLVADSLSISTLSTGSSYLAPSVEALDASLEWLSGLFNSLSTRRDAIKRVSREQCNAKLPVMRSLFPDVFPMVVKCLKVAEEEEDECDDNLSWARVSHVCRRWRQSSLSVATLWAQNPAVFGQQGLECVLARTKGLPIDIIVDDKHPLPYKDLLPRTKRLVYTASADFDREVLHNHVLTQLEELTIRPQHRHWNANPTLRMPSHPRLRVVEFSAFYTSLIPVANSLVDLKLCRPSSKELTTTELMTILQGAPLLRNVYVSRTTPHSYTPPSSSSFGGICLPQLRSICLKFFSAGEVHYIFNRLSLPCMTDARILSVHYIDQIPETYNIVPLLLRVFSDAPTFSQNIACTIKYYSTSTLLFFKGAQAGSVEISLRKPGYTVENAIDDLSLHTPRIQTLSLFSSSSISLQSWTNIFAAVNNALAFLKVHVIEPSFLKNLVTSLTSADDSDHHLIAPHLQRLGCKVQDSLSSKSRLEIWHSLSQLVTYRRQHNVPLDGMFLVEGARSDLEKLAEVLRQADDQNIAIDWARRQITFT